MLTLVPVATLLGLGLLLVHRSLLRMAPRKGTPELPQRKQQQPVLLGPPPLISLPLPSLPLAYLQRTHTVTLGLMVLPMVRQECTLPLEPILLLVHLGDTTHHPGDTTLPLGAMAWLRGLTTAHHHD